MVLDSALTGYGPSHVDIALRILLESEDNYGYCNYWNRPLNGANYPTWKVQYQIALMKEGLWGIVNGSKSSPSWSDSDKYTKFVARRDQALATIVLSVDPSLLYLATYLENLKTQCSCGRS